MGGELNGVIMACMLTARLEAGVGNVGYVRIVRMVMNVPYKSNPRTEEDFRIQNLETIGVDIVHFECGVATYPDFRLA